MRRRRHPPLPLLLLLLALAGAPSLRAEERPTTNRTWNGLDQAREVWKQAKTYFGADQERRAEILSFLDGLGTIGRRDVKKYAKRLLKYAQADGPKLTKKSGQVFEHAGLKGKVFLAGAHRRKPLFVALHGGGEGAGDGATAMQKWSLAAGRCTVLAPTAPELRATAWNQPDIERWVLALIEAAKRTWACDTDRIYLAGHSMGGFGTWSIGCRYADRFAALAPCAGGPFVMRGGPGGEQVAPGFVPNLLNTPIRFFHSTDDKQVGPLNDQAADRMLQELRRAGYAYEWVYDEYHDIGHGLPPKGLKPIVDWMLERKRNPHPKHVVWEPSRPHKRRFAWIGAKGAGRIEGRIEGNTIRLSGPGSRGPVTVYLSPELVDLDEPVRILRGDEELFAGIVPCRLAVLLQTIADVRDPRQYYCAAVTLP